MREQEEARIAKIISENDGKLFSLCKASKMNEGSTDALQGQGGDRRPTSSQ